MVDREACFRYIIEVFCLSVCLPSKMKLHLYRNPFYFHCGKFCANDLISKNYSISPRAQAQDIVPLGAHPSNRAHLFERNITAPPPLLLKSLHSGYECYDLQKKKSSDEFLIAQVKMLRLKNMVRFKWPC